MAGCVSIFRRSRLWVSELPIQSSLYQLSNGNSVIVAEFPQDSVGPSRRKEVRYDVSRFRGIRVVVPDQELQFQILDLSRTGCRLRVEHGVPAEVLPPGESVGDALLVLGRQRVMLSSIMPRGHRDDAVGCEFEVAGDPRSRQILVHFLQKLEDMESALHRINPVI